MEMKNAATLGPLEEWKRRESGRLDKRGRPYRTPRRVIKGSGVRNSSKLFSN
jgi:hypothetical protein